MYAKANFVIKAIVSCLVFASVCNKNLDPLKTLSTNLSSLSNRIDITPIKPTAPTLSLRADFFKEMMGVYEEPFFNQSLIEATQPDYNGDFKQKKLIELKKINNKDQFVVHDFNGGKEYLAGYFRIPTLVALRYSKSMLPKTGNGKFNVVVGTATHLDAPYRHTVDVGALQADPKNIDAVFQVASNFSALEPVSKNDIPDGITDYIKDYTQGPFASISAAPGLFYRMYGIFYDPAKEPAQWRQTETHQIELLGGGIKYPRLKKIFPVTNGYVNYSDYPEALNEEITAKDIEEIRIGYHSDIQVIYGLTMGSKQYDVKDKNQIINQVFTAAMDLTGLNKAYKKNPTAIQRAKVLLDAAYEGTLRAALTNGKKKVFLTLIGGGVFGNKCSWIAESIAKNKQLIKGYDLDVTLIIYNYKDLSAYSHNKEPGVMDTFKDSMIELVKFTNGNVVIDGQIKDANDIKKL